MKGKGMRQNGNKMREGDEKTEKNRASDEERERDLEEMEGWRNTDQNVRQRHTERILTVERSMEMKRRNSRKREEKREMEGGEAETRRKCWASPKGPGTGLRAPPPYHCRWPASPG